MGNGIWERITLNTGNMSQRDFISKANNFPTNKKPRLKSNTSQSGYEPDLNPQTIIPSTGGILLLNFIQYDCFH